MSNKLNEAEEAARKTEKLQQEYVEFNQLNWKTHNDLTRLQAYLEQMTRDYAKMEESNLEQHGMITDLEHTCQNLREQ
jgi:3-methyladenine DNA glycosylase Tag